MNATLKGGVARAGKYHKENHLRLRAPARIHTTVYIPALKAPRPDQLTQHLVGDAKGYGSMIFTSFDPKAGSQSEA